MSDFGSEVRMDAIHDVLRKILDTGAHSDFVLAVGEKEWKVHKIVLMMHSDMLYKMSTNERFVESQSGRAVLKEVEVDQIGALVEFMYHGRYCGPGGREGIVEYTKFHLSMIALADRYMMPTLRAFALAVISCEIVKSNVIERARQLYNNPETPLEIRREIVRLISHNLDELHGERLDALLDEMPHLAINVLKAHSRWKCLPGY
ncbi:hypothetical protein CB0940_04164 [Cercospora beticola]|uniref:BTB domain-containing protein n=1 Tax=Cercospora beticola TaxID=122368 RepID=A0A2G5HJN8_CERBT|nr:hypothetical protein CB0940_04164 [Cercospora beticola]PIA92776.1 hypothetical protein CB0940_04164 [Cercospora beticola]WPB01381.1 hypothetical protein RHO25_006007 [Cercospora beticola]